MKAKLLVVDDERGMRQLLEIVMRKEGHEVRSASSGEEALKLLAAQPCDVVISDIRMPDMNGIDLLREVKETTSDAAVILMTAYASTQTAVSALKLGAYDYLIKPFDMEELKITVRKALERRQLIDENVYLRSQLEDRRFANIIYRSAVMDKVLQDTEQVARQSSTVLLTGESGTGKLVIARAIHELGPRKDRKFLAMNCGAISETLLESELFGHVKGAFTGAVGTRRGLIELAHGGTLLLDEVGEMSLAMQVKLLDVLESKRVRPVGGSEEVPVDVRFVAATNRDLARAVAEGRFREDLFYRLNVIRLMLPPLRERREDIALLAEHFRERFAARLSKPVRGFTPEAVARLEAFHWPGNVRQLENAIERAVTLATGDLLGPDQFPDLVPAAGRAAASLVDADGFDLESHLDGIRRELISQALVKTAGRQVDAARQLGISFRSLRYYVKKYRIDAGALGGRPGAV